MREMNISYGHEFITNKITDELIIYDIWNYKDIEKKIIDDIQNIFDFNPGFDRNINTLSGGQRAITYLVTLTFILSQREIKNITIILDNILQSLTKKNRKSLLRYLEERGIDAS